MAEPGLTTPKGLCMSQSAQTNRNEPKNSDTNQTSNNNPLSINRSPQTEPTANKEDDPSSQQQGAEHDSETSCDSFTTTPEDQTQETIKTGIIIPDDYETGGPSGVKTKGRPKETAQRSKETSDTESEHDSTIENEEENTIEDRGKAGSTIGKEDLGNDKLSKSTEGVESVSETQAKSTDETKSAAIEKERSTSKRSAAMVANKLIAVSKPQLKSKTSGNSQQKKGG